MKRFRLVDWQRMLLLALSPFLPMVIILVVGLVIGTFQYDTAYFTENYVQRYQTPASLLEELEQVIQQGNTPKAAELQGIRWSPRIITPIPELQFSILWSDDGKYQDYLYIDASNNHRHVFHLKMVNGRYVWTPESLYYYVDSGRWVRTFFPILAIWWIVLFLYVVTRWVYHALTGFKPEIVNQRNKK